MVDIVWLYTPEAVQLQRQLSELNAIVKQIQTPHAIGLSKRNEIWIQRMGMIIHQRRQEFAKVKTEIVHVGRPTCPWCKEKSLAQAYNPSFLQCMHCNTRYRLEEVQE